MAPLRSSTVRSGTRLHVRMGMAQSTTIARKEYLPYLVKERRAQEHGVKLTNCHTLLSVLTTLTSALNPIFGDDTRYFHLTSSKRPSECRQPPALRTFFTRVPCHPTKMAQGLTLLSLTKPSGPCVTVIRAFVACGCRLDGKHSHGERKKEWGRTIWNDGGIETDER